MKNILKLIGLLTIWLMTISCKTEQKITAHSELSGFEKGQILKNEVIGYADTTMVHLSGLVVDNEGELLIGAEILISSKGFDSKIHADMDGRYNIYLEPKQYNLTFQQGSMDKIRIRRLNLSSGELRQIDVSLGQAGTLTHYLIEKKN